MYQTTTNSCGGTTGSNDDWIDNPFYVSTADCTTAVDAAHKQCLLATDIGGIVTGSLCGFLVNPVFIAGCIAGVNTKAKLTADDCNNDKVVAIATLCTPRTQEP